MVQLTFTCSTDINEKKRHHRRSGRTRAATDDNNREKKTGCKEDGTDRIRVGQINPDTNLISFFLPLGGVAGCAICLLLPSLDSFDGSVFVLLLRL